MKCLGSHTVGATPLLWLHTLPLRPTMFRPVPVGGSVAGAFGYPVIGPREAPSHLLQPSAQPLLNPAGMESVGAGHQGR
jgi:hypothetical protein